MEHQNFLNILPFFEKYMKNEDDHYYLFHEYNKTIFTDGRILIITHTQLDIPEQFYGKKGYKPDWKSKYNSQQLKSIININDAIIVPHIELKECQCEDKEEGIICKCCDGNGEITCNCGLHSITCTTCDGDGYESKPKSCEQCHKGITIANAKNGYYQIGDDCFYITSVYILHLLQAKLFKDKPFYYFQYDGGDGIVAQRKVLI